MLSFLPKIPSEIMDNLKTKFRTRRKSLKLTQKELSTRSSVSLGSLKRFEHTGQISLESLLKMAVVLECLGDFERVCEEREPQYNTIQEVIGKKI